MVALQQKEHSSKRKCNSLKGTLIKRKTHIKKKHSSNEIQLCFATKGTLITKELIKRNTHQKEHATHQKEHSLKGTLIKKSFGHLFLDTRSSLNGFLSHVLLVTFRTCDMCQRGFWKGHGTLIKMQPIKKEPPQTFGSRRRLL